MSANDLSEYTGIPRDRVKSILDRLSSMDTRILRRFEPEPGGRLLFEIFHDTFAAAVLDWLARHPIGRSDRKGRRAILLAFSVVPLNGVMLAFGALYFRSGRLAWLALAFPIVFLIGVQFGRLGKDWGERTGTK